MEEHKNINLENKIMADIKSGKIKLRSRYLFLSEKLGLGSVVILTVLLAALAFTLLLFYLVSADSLNYLEFGNSGIWAFLESFPFPLVITLILLIFLAGRLLALTGRAYAYSFGKLAVILLGIILLIGSGLALTNLAEKIAGQRFVRPFMIHRLGQHDRGIAGQVIAVGKNILVVRNPHSDLRVNTSGVNWRHETQPELGNFIIAIGKWHEKEFFASHIKLARPKDLRLLRPHIRMPINGQIQKMK